MRDAFTKAATAAATAYVQAQEAEIKRLLGMWVSELEPILIMGPGGRFLGLGQAGVAEVALPARPIEVAFTVGDDPTRYGYPTGAW